MIEITGNDIKELSDSDLRSLIGLLCEADLRAQGLQTAGVTWGGHQNARDGGIDVRVELTSAIHNDNFVPRAKTCFQVKKPDMPRSAIINEMRPNGELRQVIKDLVDCSGAYIIVSSQGSTADSALKDRKDAMQEVVSDHPNATNIKVDFYDRERIAGWVRCHPALILWVRDKIGRPIHGWRTYGNWANCPGGVEEEYMLDGHIRLYNSVNPRSGGFSSIDGINELRSVLQSSGSSVRLVGLSGVGKTRLLQCLFDERIGERPLNQSQVFYSDVSYSPSPDPRNFAEQIIALQKPAILAIDNCPPDLHRRLTSVCSTSGSLVSLITVEYDVREDQPEETEVFRLEPASVELIKEVISARFSYISQVDARTIAEFSGGNARIAIALANTVKRGENLGDLRDVDLFDRLFQQRNEPNSSLMRTAEVCSLVYSFDSQTVEGDIVELRILGSLANMSIPEIYQSVSELKRRDLVQQRGIWRAVLPHAIANKLAQRALENIPLDYICTVFENCHSERLLRSFSRRLSYLHESEKAKEISKRWLSKNGILADVINLNELGISLFKNIAPINPDLTLSAIESVLDHEDAKTFFSRENYYYSDYTRLLRSLAYDSDLFERSASLLIRFALSESPKENYNSIRELLKSLFYIKLSGTHATPEQRLKIIAKLLESNLDNHTNLGFSLLNASLESWHFGTHYNFEFGARSRDYGYSPSSREDIVNWFSLFINYTVTLAVSDLPVAPKAKVLLAEKFSGLWIRGEMYDELEFAAKELSGKGAWKEGWVAVRTTKRFDSKDMSPEVLSRLNELEVILKPVTLIEKAKLFALSRGSALDLIDAVGDDEEEKDDYLLAEAITRSLGHDVALNEDIFEELLPDILSNDGVRLYDFGQGLADGCKDAEKMWRNFCSQLSLIDESKRSYQVIRGFLNSISKINLDITEFFLDEAVLDRVLATVYPWLQTSVEINLQGVKRLKRSLELGVAPIWQYTNLAYGRAHETICDADLCELIRLISSEPEGNAVSVKILQMRLHGHSKTNALSDVIISTGQELLLNFEFCRKNNKADHDYELAQIVKACFANESSEEKTKVLCDRLVKAFANYDIHSMDYGYLLKALITVQPIAFLDGFFGEDVKLDYRVERVFSRSCPLSLISEDLIINWCEGNSKTRYPIIASVLIPYRKSQSQDLLEWSSLAQKIIANAADPIVVLNEFKSSLRPTSWSGSRAEILRGRLCLISALKAHENLLIADWASKEERKFEEEIRAEFEWESKRNSVENERFE